MMSSISLIVLHDKSRMMNRNLGRLFSCDIGNVDVFYHVGQSRGVHVCVGVGGGVVVGVGVDVGGGGSLDVV